MRVERSAVIGSVLLLIMPLLALLHSIATLRSGNRNSSAYFLIAVCYFFLFLKIPPLSDLYRHYSVYESINSATHLSDIMLGKVDLILHANIYLFKTLGVPFYIIPALYAALGVYAYLNALNIVLLGSGKVFSPRQFVLLHLAVLFLINPFIIAMGLRFGFSIAIMTLAMVMLCERKHLHLAVFLLLFAMLTHFSSMLLLGVFLCSRFFLLNRLLTVVFSALAFLNAKYALPFILSHITISGIDSYSSVYTSGLYASEYLTSGNANGMINFLIVLFPALFLGVYLLAYPMRNQPGDIRNYAAWLVVFIFLSSSSLQAASRYASAASIFLLFYYISYPASFIRGRFNYFFLFLMLMATGYNLIENIYVPRRPILLGQMWESLYNTPLLNVFYGEEQYERYLNHINRESGEWIGHEMDGA
ncbi:EpsG-like putative glucosyltransferase [Gibbsiella quercinecans]|uniref:EpsG family protein n=1 Tax=Gibbsiella quercinecans TaxID=929813 RepID=A0A250B6F9_9GAMM|nr:EpsG family protein [Gibbsiella quercinecans]ATA21833.1 hypothetical protein AWC35_22255 [Gibbsiella quercinecans]RLM08204.1 hypothetical protein BIY30_13240 [Gibbsiella quercinecans]TCT85330.1 EpsG-like putative glucosyltransferase [Gibbsiella quercinecans]